MKVRFTLILRTRRSPASRACAVAIAGALRADRGLARQIALGREGHGKADDGRDLAVSVALASSLVNPAERSEGVGADATGGSGATGSEPVGSSDAAFEGGGDSAAVAVPVMQASTSSGASMVNSS